MTDLSAQAQCDGARAPAMPKPGDFIWYIPNIDERRVGVTDGRAVIMTIRHGLATVMTQQGATRRVHVCIPAEDFWSDEQTRLHAGVVMGRWVPFLRIAPAVVASSEPAAA